MLWFEKIFWNYLLELFLRSLRLKEVQSFKNWGFQSAQKKLCICNWLKLTQLGIYVWKNLIYPCIKTSNFVMAIFPLKRAKNENFLLIWLSASWVYKSRKRFHCIGCKCFVKCYLIKREKRTSLAQVFKYLSLFYVLTIRHYVNEFYKDGPLGH